MHSERQPNISMFTGGGGVHRFEWYETEPLHFSMGKASEISVAASWMRGSTESCCATPLIPENDVIMLKVSVIPYPQPTSIISLSHTIRSVCGGGVWRDVVFGQMVMVHG